MVEYTLTNAADAEVGQDMHLFRTIEPDTSESADERPKIDDAILRDSWEITYVYAVSIFVALWVVVRAICHWRFDAVSSDFVL